MSAPSEESELADDLLVEFIRLHEAGRVPEPTEFVVRAADEGPRLRELLAVYLAEAEPVVPTDEAAVELAGGLPVPEGFVDDLLVEFIRLHETGRVPEPTEFVVRAADEGPRLRELLAVYLAEAEPVVPTDEAALAVARRWKLAAAGEGLDRVPEPEPAPESPAQLLLRRWGEATPGLRTKLIEGVTAAIFGFSLTPEALRGEKEGSVVPLDHPPGARLEVRRDRYLWLLVYGLWADVVGTRPLVAFADAEEFGGVGFEWDAGERGLPVGIAEAAEPVGGSGELQVRIGRMPHPNDPAPVPSRIWVLAVEEEGDGVAP